MRSRGFPCWFGRPPERRSRAAPGRDNLPDARAPVSGPYHAGRRPIRRAERGRCPLPEGPVRESRSTSSRRLRALRRLLSPDTRLAAARVPAHRFVPVPRAARRHRRRPPAGGRQPPRLWPAPYPTGPPGSPAAPPIKPSNLAWSAHPAVKPARRAAIRPGDAPQNVRPKRSRPARALRSGPGAVTTRQSPNSDSSPVPRLRPYRTFATTARGRSRSYLGLSAGLFFLLDIGQVALGFLPPGPGRIQIEISPPITQGFVIEIHPFIHERPIEQRHG